MKSTAIQSTQRGFTALELIIVLVIGISIIGMSASKMGEMFGSSKTAQALTNILSLNTAIQALYGKDKYANADNVDLVRDLINLELVPKGIKVDNNNSLINEWNSNIPIVSAANGVGFKITYAKVPKSVCTKLAKNLIESGSFSSIEIGNDKLTTKSTTSDYVTACSVNQDSDFNIFSANL